jgi:putative phage-type endonuclease
MHDEEGYLTTPRLEEVRAIPLVAQRTPQWFKAREKRITGSIVDTILGTNPYQTIHSLVAEKAGVKNTFFGNAATRHGNKYEEVALIKYCEIYDRKHVELGVIPHATVDFLAHSPDGIGMSKTLKPVLLEVKCPYSRKIEPGVVPKQYVHQILMGLEVFDLEEAHFIQYRPATDKNPEEFDVTVVYREPNWLTRNVAAFERFWSAVEAYKSHVLPLLTEELEIK